MAAARTLQRKREAAAEAAQQLREAIALEQEARKVGVCERVCWGSTGVGVHGRFPALTGGARRAASRAQPSACSSLQPAPCLARGRSSAREQPHHITSLEI